MSNVASRQRSRNRALWTIAIALAVIALAAGGIFWLRVAGEQKSVVGERPEAEAVAQSPLQEIATAVGVDEERCDRDVVQPSDGRLTGLPHGKSPIENPRSNFSVKFKDEVSPYSLMSAFVLPGEQLEIEAVFTEQPAELRASSEVGDVTLVGPQKWRWTAPNEPGVHCVRIADEAKGTSTCLNVFVMVPYHGEDTVNGYRIGHYQTEPLKGLAAYNVPLGLVEVTEKNLGTWVSPHFQLSQFVGKQASGFPKYVVLRSRLLLKLEMVLERLRERGIDTDALYVMSGYRTPYYNASIGNTTKYSRHSYGDAADIFVDRDGNRRMDDINGDGKSDLADSLVIYGMLDGFSADAWYHQFEGGLGLYPPNPRFGPMVHTDTRGQKVRWKGAG
ncbi:MAG TPA: D-Ala-D-Ala carboxypeptidase family metallohydrolase [Thermoanaerobaculia bacterium]|jgi:hypothetical protein|nr:D-Ala-D-Ala carboxypeptidase family metallohydrolase [Thermoanaerobaculia bacterium]